MDCWRRPQLRRSGDRWSPTNRWIFDCKQPSNPEPAATKAALLGVASWFPPRAISISRATSMPIEELMFQQVSAVKKGIHRVVFGREGLFHVHENLVKTLDSSILLQLIDSPGNINLRNVAGLPPQI